MSNRKQLSNLSTHPQHTTYMMYFVGRLFNQINTKKKILSKYISLLNQQIYFLFIFIIKKKNLNFYVFKCILFNDDNTYIDIVVRTRFGLVSFEIRCFFAGFYLFGFSNLIEVKRKWYLMNKTESIFFR